MDRAAQANPAPLPLLVELPLDLDLGMTADVVPIARARAADKPRPTKAKRAGKQKPTATGCSDALFMVAEFHTAFGLPTATLPTTSLPADLRQLRVDLLVEEVSELAQATEAKDIVGIADALADILYVTYGAAISYGIDLDAVVREVHRSNMSKLDSNGRPILREDGKVLKSSRYTAPDIVSVITTQLPLPF